MPNLELATEIEHSMSEASAKRGADGDPSIVTEWIKGAQIGTGSVGAVFLGMDRSTALLMAVKQLELPGSAAYPERKKSIVDTVEREIELAKILRHKTILQYLWHIEVWLRETTLRNTHGNPLTTHCQLHINL
ncbi:hypothetical protein DFH08DRAFT_1000345 [Mycena albidolilacea]|uniref:Protein kinase domain-containing protein n=1 Tax=Mycena albidolilacea TaxID=1033008 RepID=A0AAD7A3V3_9AGAR|nr:hypothetical protein DFH08DRAFT_1000345 [Mycena albidolilacea]